ncbi:glycosyltransferase family 87 protein [Kitasatospora azatica]|uniref:glycosyltransferase family 87 protein n=1 Tax=Kitasatospora azatica TaxID=58347 RepID=UPI000A046162|nr:glycosyltransferase family 87 protein [Kitasatospora azatica]
MSETITETRPAAGDSTGSSSAGGRPALVWWNPTSWPGRIIAPLGYWVSTRLIMIMTVFQTRENSNGEVHKLYQAWAQILRHGSYPIGDPTWQYPPGAAGVILAPLAVPGVNYVQGFVVVTIVADLVVMGALLRYGSRPGRSLAGAWVWLLTLPLMTYIPYARYDVIVTLFAVLALLWLQRRPWLGGGMAALGAMIKVWPAFAVFGAPRGRSLRSAVIGFVASAVALVLIAMALFKGSFDFLNGQGNRGVEFESLPGSILLLAHQFGYKGNIAYRYGSLEIVGPHVETIGKAMLVLSVLGFCWLLLWRLRARTFSDATPADAALAVVLVFITTSRVISPQYLIWVAGIGAVCLSFKSTTQRPIVGLLVLATAMTTVEFPLFWQDVIAGKPGFDTLLAARNLILLVATVWSCGRLWRATVPRGRRRGISK